jgi:hypothetical protein
MAAKHLKISALSIDIHSVDNAGMMSPFSPLVSNRFVQPCITPEQQAGKEIQYILHKRTRPDLLSCAAPLPWRFRAAHTDSSDEEEFPGDLTQANPRINDTHFMQRHDLSEMRVSVIGSELGMLRLSPVSF